MITTPITQTQLDACTRRVDIHGNAFYEVQSASDPDTTYTVRWHGFRPVDNCSAGRRGADCWHCRAAAHLEQLFQGIVNPGEVEANRHEAEQLALHGFKAYESEAFSLLR